MYLEKKKLTDMKKIMFNKPYGLEDAVIDGRKPITRRIVSEEIMAKAKAYQWQYFAETNEDLPLEDALLKFSPYKVGEVVAIAQAYKYVEPELKTSGVKRVYNQSLDIYEHPLVLTPGWDNKMFVKAELMPNKIRISSVGVEFLQNISDEDCLREGVLHSDKYAMPYGIQTPAGVFFYYSTPREAFAALIDKISGRFTWGSNPYVFVYEFELVK